MDRHTLLKIILCVGALLGAILVGVGVYLYWHEATRFKTITLTRKHDNIDSRFWSEYVGDDPEWTGHPSHTFGRATGETRYSFFLYSKPIAPVAVTATLSSELYKVGPQNPSKNPRDASDVVLMVNGTEQGERHVIPDNGFGEEYTWDVDPGVFQLRNNTVGFRVKPGTYANGLCVYGDVKVSYTEDSEKR